MLFYYLFKEVVFVYIFGKGFNFSQDGPGNRLVYHLSGCNMTCPWCSNPEGLSTKSGNVLSVNEIINECISCKAMFFLGGGVTFTGGECTLHHNELYEILKALKSNNIHTCIETNGTSEKLTELLPFVDYLIMDFKHYDDKVLKSFTGVDCKTIKHNFEEISKIGRQLHIRIPLINNFNTQNPQGFVDYFTKHNTSNIIFEFLPYHEYGKEKWKTEYKIKDGFITEEILKLFIKAFTNSGLKITKT